MKTGTAKFDENANAFSGFKKKAEYANYLIELVNQLKIENKSNQTIKLYKNNLIRLFNYYSYKSPEDISVEDVRNYLLELKDQYNRSSSFQSGINNSYKYFNRKVLNKNIDFKRLPHPKKPKLLPRVLSAEEIKSFLKLLIT